MREGGAPEEAIKGLELLLKDNQDGAKRLDAMGLNESVSDLDPTMVEETPEITQN